MLHVTLGGRCWPGRETVLLVLHPLAPVREPQQHWCLLPHTLLTGLRRCLSWTARKSAPSLRALALLLPDSRGLVTRGDWHV